MNCPASGRDLPERNTSLFRDHRVLWLALLSVAAVAVFVRVRLLDIPFERDEGEYAYTARLILSGVPPYVEAYDLKMPGLHLVYAFFLYIFGNSVRGVHSGLLVLNSLSVVCIFFTGRKLYGCSGGIISASAFVLLSVSQRVYGFSANAEPVLLLPLLCGLVILVSSSGTERRGRLFLSGFLFGLAFIVKQTAVFFIIFAFVYICLSEYRKKERLVAAAFKKGFLFLMGVLLPFCAVSVTLFWAGAFKEFWFWTFQYALIYGSVTPVSLGLKSLGSALAWIVPPVIVFWGVAGFYLFVQVSGKRGRGNIFFEFSFFLFSTLSVSAGLYFREHYFILLIPAISLLFGGGTLYLAALAQKGVRFGKPDTVPALILCLAVIQMLYSEKEYLFSYTPEEVSRATYNVNPFVESIKIAEYIKNNTGPEERVAILGSEPQIFFYSNRLSASRHIVMYPLMNPNALEMQVELIEDIERVEPKLLLFVKAPGSWGLKEDSEKLVFSWINKYVSRHYVKSGVVEIDPPGPSRFYRDEEVPLMEHDITYGVYIFKRR